MAVPLALLHTFVVVARAGRMRDAASLMALTPGAISQRVRALEDSLGARLFTRTRSGIELNAAGRALFDDLDLPFRRIEEAGGRTSPVSARRVRITTLASFASDWLVPRLAGFSQAHPGIDIVLETGGRVVDLAREPVDLAIRHCLGSYAGLESVRLMSPEAIVVGSPGLLRSRPPIETPADCLAFPLLHGIDRADWRLWFEAHGVAAPPDLKGPSFSDEHLMVRAAAAGQGLALVADVYVESELRAGRLEQAIALKWPTRFAYYAVATPEALQRPAVRRFRDWVVAEACGG